MKAKGLLALLISLFWTAGVFASVADSARVDSLPAKTSSQQQAARSITDIMPPSPTVSSILRYGDVPVNYSTGIPEISIPLYTIRCGNLEMPIKLSYHAGGIKVDDAASWVGLGWSIMTGGTIGGKVRPGGNDDYYPITIPPLEQVKNKEFAGFKWEDLDAARGLHTIFSPHWYSYFVNGMSGKLLYNPNNVMLYNAEMKKDLTFEKKADIFNATDNYGNKYVFDVIEKTINRKGDSGSSNTAWHLSKLTSHLLRMEQQRRMAYNRGRGHQLPVFRGCTASSKEQHAV